MQLNLQSIIHRLEENDDTFIPIFIGLRKTLFSQIWYEIRVSCVPKNNHAAFKFK